MKYIIDHRYKKLNAICVHTNTILSICKRGRSNDLATYIKALQDELNDLEPLKSTPFSEKQIQCIEQIEEKSRLFLLLPEDLEKAGLDLLSETEGLMIDIDPFAYSLEDSIGIRKSQLVELAKELQVYIHAHILSLEGKASSIIDEKLIIQDISSDISRINKKALKKVEKVMIDKLLKQNDEYQKEPSLKTTRPFSDLALAAEHVFSEKKAPYKTLAEMIKFLAKVYATSDKNMTSEKESFSKFTSPLRESLVSSAISQLKDLKLNSKPLQTCRENLIFAYENGAVEDGGTFISRCRAIDFYKLFGHELEEFEDLLRDRPDKDMKLS